ncbi:TonB-dependent siderophore receptor [Janthinobacterium sp. GW460P]|uniref:TonB-dependent siderophore receptor n=1 Tax=unclassified Janthinobacterium TaxID=2610881 RepID=UPI000A324F42|nr:MULTISPECIES: TonB-dependent receptor [unclassified Janthinobacterium]MCC7701758.1 TonB-dependent siderophore receptor [Janthinobacterium sp. GW460P]MCC7707266.1 TonB-dependent siderophore receptor [Janthinobacterium sp. GW460W]
MYVQVVAASSPHTLRTRLRPLALAALLLAGAGMHVQALAQAHPATASYSIPAGPLAGALNRYAQQAGVSIVIDAARVQGLQSPGLQGSYALDDGFAALLRGSGYAIGKTSTGYVLVAAPAPAPTAAAASASAGERTMPSITIVGQSEQGATTEGSGSYTARKLTIGKGEQSMKEIPQSVSVLTRQRLDDQGITDLREAVNNVTGVVGVHGVGPGVVITARGFQIDQWQYDGVPIDRNTYALGNWGQENMVIYDRLEVLRGASGMLVGTGSPGGSVNLVRKRPLATRAITLTGRAGSWDHYGVQADISAPLNAAGTLRGRAIVDEDDSHSFIDQVWSKNRTLYAALDYDLAPATTVGLAASHVKAHGRPTFIGLPRYADGSELPLPRSTFTGADWNRSLVEQSTVYLDLEHHFNTQWSLKASALGMNESTSSTHQRTAFAIKPDGSGARYGDFSTDFDNRKRGIDAFARGKFDGMGIAQEIVVGASYVSMTSNDRYARAWETGADIFNIKHNRPWQDFDTIAARPAGVTSYSTYDMRQKGLYATWNGQLTGNLKALLGGRFSWYDFLYATPDGYRDATRTTAKFTPSVGLLYALNPQWSLYGSYADIFTPQTNHDVAGRTLKPITGSNYEAGIKGELLDGKVNTALAVFRYEHKDRAVTDYAAGFACDGWYCSRASGKVRSQGLEAEASGEVARGLQLSAGYAYTTTTYLDDPDNKGQVFSTWTPKHMLRLWSSYTLPGAWDKFSVGAGASLQSHTLDTERTFKVAGFSIWSARLGWQATPQVALSVNVNNLFDKRYIIPSYNTTGSNNYYGDPRNVQFTLKYTPKW